MSVHVVLVSSQILQNLIPVLMGRPEQVVMVVTREMESRHADQHLRRQLHHPGIEAVVCKGCPDTDFAAIQSFARQVAEQVMDTHAGSEILLNATGGTKLLSLAFVEAFRGIASRILYTDTAHRQIQYLPHADGVHLPLPVPMTNVLDVPGYLRAQGFQFQGAASDLEVWQIRAQGREQASQFLGKRIASAQLQRFIGNINGLAGKALERIPDSFDERLAAAEQSFSRPPWGIWAEAMRVLAQAQVLDWTPGSKWLQFPDVSAARFVRGGWLEEYAYQVVRDADVHDVRLGVRGVWDNKHAMANEFDVLACHLNQLLLIECKTLHYNGENDNEIAYKLDSLGDDARGLFGDTWLLSAREPTETLVARAHRARIRLIGPRELQNLRDLVRTWKNS